MRRRNSKMVLSLDWVSPTQYTFEFVSVRKRREGEHPLRQWKVGDIVCCHRLKARLSLC